MTATAIRRTHRHFSRSLGAWVAQLVKEFPGFDEYDLAQMIEEKTGIPLEQDDFEQVSAHYLRAKLQAWEPETC